MVGFGNINLRDIKLPKIRDDIKVSKGASSDIGAPRYVIFDEIRNRYFNIGWLEYEILTRWKLENVGEIVDSINKNTTIEVNEQNVVDLLSFMQGNFLLKLSGESDFEYFKKVNQLKNINKFQWLIHNYLFFKIKLLNPDKLLSKIEPCFRFLYKKSFAFLFGLISFFAIYVLQENWYEFSSTFSYFYSIDGLFVFFLCLAFVKLVHELGHGITAKYYGSSVHSFGLAFVVMCPVLFTDTSSSWLLKDKRQRFLIGASGMLAEIMIAVIATILWKFVDDGAFRSALFMLATTSWIGTLLINLSPFMRFDGYYLLSDYMDIANLQNRSFDMARWYIRKKLFGIKKEAPEYFESKKQRFLILYAFGVWIYRFFLFLGIALTVYHFLFKIIGIFLMAVEIKE